LCQKNKSMSEMVRDRVTGHHSWLEGTPLARGCGNFSMERKMGI
jgi:hypothetical protein